MKLEDLEISVVTKPKLGQRVGELATGVRIVHIPTGITALCSSERSQYKNKAVALAMIEYGLAELGL